MDIPPAVVALAGARDYFQVPLALHEGGLLEALVTELYCPLDRPPVSLLARHPRVRDLALTRYAEGLDGRKVVLSKSALLYGLLSLRDARYNRLKDAAIGRRARRLALERGAPLFCYSYYAASAFRPPAAPAKRFLFQVHPDPRTSKGILVEEMERTPAARESLRAEYELSLPDDDLQRLCDEPALANGWVAASGFTARSLAANGVPPEKIHVVPYGVDSRAFPPRLAPPRRQDPFTVIYVGSMSQRKGLADLLEAVGRIDGPGVRLVLCGRGVIDHGLIRNYRIKDLEVHVNLRRADLIDKLHASDVFVLPTLVEGFGHVILEAMSCGVPVVSTPNSCAPDLVRDGVEGFVVPIRSPASIAAKLSWGLEHRSELAAMGMAASTKAATMTWARFREGIRDAYRAMVGSVEAAAPPSGHARGAAGLVRQVPGAASGTRAGG